MNWVAIVFILYGLAMTFAFLGAMVQKGESDEKRRTAEADRDRAVRGADGALTPLIWVWREENAMEPEPHARTIAFTAQALGSLQVALGLDDDIFGAVVASTVDPPRRLPKYPMIPPALARPEDVAKIPTSPPRGRAWDPAEEARTVTKTEDGRLVWDATEGEARELTPQEAEAFRRSIEEWPG